MALGLEQEHSIAQRRRRQCQQPRVPQKKFAHQRRWLEFGGDAEGAPLHVGRSALAPDEGLSVIEQRQQLQAVALQLDDRLGIAGRVDQDRQEVRQQGLRARVQARFDLAHAAKASQGLVELVLPRLQTLQHRGNDAAAMAVDVLQQTTQGVEAAVGRRQACLCGLTHRTHLGDVLLAGVKDRSQVVRGDLGVRLVVAIPPWKGAEGVVDSGDDPGTAARQPLQQLAQAGVRRRPACLAPWLPVAPALRIEPFDVPHQHHTVHVGQALDALGLAHETIEGVDVDPVGLDGVRGLNAVVTPEGFGQRQPNSLGHVQCGEVDQGLAHQARRVQPRWRGTFDCSGGGPAR